MAESSTFRGVLEFFDRLGVYDVVLPFLLVFTLVFAMLDKTRVFGVDKVGSEEYPKKNLNAMVAFVVAFFTIASSKLVAIITEISANVVILLVASVFFLMLVGSFHEETEKGFFLNGAARGLFMAIMFVGLLFIFANAIETNGKTWLQWVFHWISNIANETSVAAVALFLLVLGIMFMVTGAGPRGRKSEEHH